MRDRKKREGKGGDGKKREGQLERDIGNGNESRDRDERINIVEIQVI